MAKRGMVGELIDGGDVSRKMALHLMGKRMAAMLIGKVSYRRQPSLGKTNFYPVWGIGLLGEYSHAWT